MNQDVNQDVETLTAVELRNLYEIVSTGLERGEPRGPVFSTFSLEM